MNGTPAPVHGPTALIAEDEPLLAAALQAELARAWPALQVLAMVGDGRSAVREALRLLPDVLFLDIRMPGLSGLEAAAELLDGWPDDATRPFPALVFVTAYDQYAVQAFEAQAVDYLLKPLRADRLARTVERLQARLAGAASASAASALPEAASAVPAEALMAQLRALLGGTPTTAPAAPRLSVIQASVGSTIHLVPLDEVLYFEAADKYVRVLTAEREYLIRTPLRELIVQLDPERFWQVHRGTLVRAEAIAQVQRDEAGKLWLLLRGRPERLPVSRLYAHLFRAM